MSSRLAEKEARRQERQERTAEAEAAERRRQRTRLGAGGLVLLLAVAVVAVALANQGGGAKTEAVKAPPPPGDSRPFGTHYQGLVERRKAAQVPTMMQTMNSPVHIHPLLAVYVNGKRVPLPANIGIDPRVDPMQMAGLHTHDSSGTVHVEGVAGARLGQFFQIWGVPLSATQLGPYRADAHHAVRMGVDGKPSTAFGQLLLVDAQRIVVSYQSRKATRPPV